MTDNDYGTMSGDYEDGNPLPTILSPAHKKMLQEESGISEELIAKAGLFTVTTAKQIQLLGWSKPTSLIMPVPALAIPVYNVLGEVAYHRLRPDTPREIQGKIAKYEQPRGVGVTLYVPPTVLPSLSKPDTILIITEGEKKSLCLASHNLPAVGLMGIDSWKGTNKDGGKTVLPDWNHIDLKGKRVYIAFDSDMLHKPSVGYACKRLHDWLQFRGAEPLVIYLPNKEDGSKQGVDDFLASGKTPADMFALALPLQDVRAALNLKREVKAEVEAQSGRPCIETKDRELRDISNDITAALINANKEKPQVFVYGGMLTRIKPDEKCRPRAQALDPEALRWHVAESARFISTSEKFGAVFVYPPMTAVTNVCKAPEWPGMPVLSGIVTAPHYAADGTLHDTPGYNPASGNYYFQQGSLCLPDTTPTPANIAAALNLLRKDMLGDFPFDTPASEANTLAMMFLPFVRSLIVGSTPLHILDAPQKGSGKTLLAQVCVLPFAPQGVDIVIPPEAKEEWGKTLLSNLAESPSHFLLDNARTLDSKELDGALTADTYKSRWLGTNENRSVPVRCVWIATSNNLRAGGDLSRRAVWIRLNANEEKPYERGGFKHADLKTWILENRAQIVGAILTIIRAWIENGRPAYAGTAKKGSYESWLNVLGGILENVGITDFLGNAAEAETALDSDIESWRGFLETWWKDYKSIRKEASASDLVPCASEHFPDDGALFDPNKRNQRMGYLLRSNVNRTAGNYQLIRCHVAEGEKKPKSGRYAIIQIRPEPDEPEENETQDTPANAPQTAVSGMESAAETEQDELPIPDAIKAIVKQVETGNGFPALKGVEFTLPTNPPKPTADIGFTIKLAANKYRNAMRDGNTESAKDALEVLGFCETIIAEDRKEFEEA